MGLLLAGLALAGPITVEAALEQTPTLSPEDARGFADGVVTEIATAVATVDKLLAEAKREGNTETIECLSRKLVAMKALQTVAGQSRAAMAASAHPDGEVRKVAVALSRVRDFLAEAHACVADASASTGKAQVSVSGEPADGPVLADIGDVGPGDKIDCLDVYVWDGGGAPAASPGGSETGSGEMRTYRYCF